MFDDPTALRSDWHDSTALGKYRFVPSMCNNSFCRVKFPNCLKHNISIQMSIQSINDEWWVYIVMDPHYSNNIFVYGTTHETGHKQPKFVSSENAHYSFLNLTNIQKACIIYQSEIDIYFFPELHSSKKCPHNKMSSQRRLAHVLYIWCKQYSESIFCFVIN